MEQYTVEVYDKRDREMLHKFTMETELNEDAATKDVHTRIAYQAAALKAEEFQLSEYDDPKFYELFKEYYDMIEVIVYDPEITQILLDYMDIVNEFPGLLKFVQGDHLTNEEFCDIMKLKGYDKVSILKKAYQNIFETDVEGEEITEEIIKEMIENPGNGYIKSIDDGRLRYFRR